MLRCSRSAAAAAALDHAAAARLAVGRILDEALSQERYAENPAFDDPAARKVLSRHVLMEIERSHRAHVGTPPLATR